MFHHQVATSMCVLKTHAYQHDQWRVTKTNSTCVTQAVCGSRPASLLPGLQQLQSAHQHWHDPGMAPGREQSWRPDQRSCTPTEWLLPLHYPQRGHGRPATEPRPPHHSGDMRLHAAEPNHTLVSSKYRLQYRKKKHSLHLMQVCHAIADGLSYVIALGRQHCAVSSYKAGLCCCSQ